MAFGSILSGAQNIGGQIQSIGSSLGVNSSGLSKALSSASQLQSALAGIFGLIENSTISKGFGIQGSTTTLDFREDPHYDNNSPIEQVSRSLSGVNDTINQISSVASTLKSLKSSFGG